MYHSRATTISTLTKVHMVGNNLADFNNRWFAVLNHLLIIIDDDSLRDLHFEHMGKAPCLNEDVKWYQKLPHDHHLRNYRWLLTVVEKHINKWNESKLIKAYTDAAGKPDLTNYVMDTRYTKAQRAGVAA